MYTRQQIREPDRYEDAWLKAERDLAIISFKWGLPWSNDFQSTFEKDKSPTDTVPTENDHPQDT